MKGIFTAIMMVVMVGIMAFIWGPFNTDTLNVPVETIYRVIETVISLVVFAIGFKKVVIEN